MNSTIQQNAAREFLGGWTFREGQGLSAEELRVLELILDEEEEERIEGEPEDFCPMWRFDDGSILEIQTHRFTSTREEAAFVPLPVPVLRVIDADND